MHRGHGGDAVDQTFAGFIVFPKLVHHIQGPDGMNCVDVIEPCQKWRIGFITGMQAAIEARSDR